jgi:hypothetical protein
MQTEKSLFKDKCILFLPVFFSICSFIVSCETTKKVTIPTTCSPVWGTWDVIFDAGISGDEKNTLKAGLETSINQYVNTTDANGITCSVTGKNWNDIDANHSELTVCVACQDRRGPRTDTTASRPPTGVRPPAGRYTATYKTP